LPIASCSLRLDDKAVRISVGLRLGLLLCVPHLSNCGSSHPQDINVCQLESRYLFHPVGWNGIICPLDCLPVTFLSGLSRRITDISGKTREGSVLFQWMFVMIKHFNTVLLHDCFDGEVAGHFS